LAVFTKNLEKAAMSNCSEGGNTLAFGFISPTHLCMGIIVRQEYNKLTRDDIPEFAHAILQKCLNQSTDQHHVKTFFYLRMLDTVILTL
jgi:hypothetical protein